MKDYFQLQFAMAGRKLREAGIHPAVAYTLGIAGFAGTSWYLFQLTEFAGYLVLLAALGVLLNLSDKNRTDFLLMVFGSAGKKRLRTAENLIVALPFMMALMVHGAYIETAVLFALAVVMAAFSFHTGFSFTMPTPFSRHPFEFAVGFRKTFYLFPVAYALTIIAINVDNPNLGIFAMLLVFVISMSYYAKPENEYYVWVHALTPAGFLFNKLKLAARNVLLLNLPVLVSLLIFFPQEYRLMLIFFLIGFLFLMTIILAKYSAYPQEMNIPKGILIAFSIYFPPFLLVLMPFFYLKSVKKLKVFLDDQN